MRFIATLSLVIATSFALPTGDLSVEYAIENRIAGGDAAAPAEFPFQVGIQMRKVVEEGEFNAWCGGSLISDQVVLTAAHCLHLAVSAEIFVGANDLSKEEEGRMIIHVPQESLIVHENYKPNLLENDIALVRLPQRITFTKSIQPVNLPRRSQQDETFVKSIGWISGWGGLGDGKGTPSILQYTRRWILPDDYCDYYFPGNFKTKTQVCVDGSHGISACRGDSGGPLTVIEEDGSRTLVGATSYGRAYCEQDFPVVYTRVTAFLDWIAEKGGITLRD